MTPPIRGGLFQPDDRDEYSQDEKEEKALDGDNQYGEKDGEKDGEHLDYPSLCPTVSHDSDDAASTGYEAERPCQRRKAATPDLEKAAWDDKCASGANSLSDGLRTDLTTMSPTEFTDWAVHHNIDKDLRDYPSLDLLVQQDIVKKYRQLHQQVQDEGLYTCRFIEYGKEMVRYSMLFAAFFVALRYEWHMTSAIFLGLFWHQIMFTAHDAGHRAITQNFVIDTLIGTFVADFCCGLSIGWWKRSHNVHHLVTNHPEHDPDIQNLPLFATCPSCFRSLYSTYYNFAFVWDAVAAFLVPYQHYTYYPIMGVARFNLYLLSWKHVLSAHASSLGGTTAWWIRPVEIAFMATYWFLFGYLLVWLTLPTWPIRIAFVLLSHIITMPLHVQITLSHWGMSTAELGASESFAQRQLRTTMDVDCPRWLDFIHGGLQFQAVHHLFPRVPRHNLRRVQELGLAFARDAGIPYAIYSFVDGNCKVVNRLAEVSEQVRILVACQKYMAETGVRGL